MEAAGVSGQRERLKQIRLRPGMDGGGGVLASALLKRSGYQTISTAYAANVRSLVTIGMRSANDCEISTRSNGSR